MLNARADPYLRRAGADDAVRRANAYRKAGAHSLFVPGVRDRETIARLVEAIDGPLNVLAGPGTRPIRELEALGIARVSVGGGLAQAALGAVQRGAHELRGPGTYDFAGEGPTRQALQALFRRSAPEKSPGFSDT